MGYDYIIRGCLQVGGVVSRNCEKTISLDDNSDESSGNTLLVRDKAEGKIFVSNA